jgi:hypothetical protein
MNGGFVTAKSWLVCYEAEEVSHFKTHGDGVFGV